MGYRRIRKKVLHFNSHLLLFPNRRSAEAMSDTSFKVEANGRTPST